MTGILLTQDSGIILGPVSKLLGYLMEAIFFVIDSIGIPNIGLAIIIFTIVINLCMLPLTIRQQKFSKLNAKMNPELMAIRKKYEGKKDNASVMAMNEETQAVYNKYGVSPTGSCVQLLIQMPILFALYRVINSMPAYVTKIKETFLPLVDKLIDQPGSAEFIQEFKNSTMYAKQFTNELFTGGNMEYVQNTYVDCLNKASTSEWLSIADKYPELASDVTATLEQLDVYNSFLGLNIANSPSYIIKEAWAAGAILMVVGAIMIPLISALTQWINTKLIPQTPSTGDASADSMAQSMKTMNVTMPIMSAFFCFTLPAGMGIYWIAGSVVRSVQQILINKHIDRMDWDAEIAKNVEKQKKKKSKKSISAEKMNQYASMNTKKVMPVTTITSSEKEEAMKKAAEYSRTAKPGSIAAKAGMVREYNERNNK